MNKIKIYTNNTCPYCKQVKKEFTENNIEFENLLTSENTSDWQSIVNLTGIPTVPTIHYKGTYFVSGRDFGSPAHLVDIIKNYEKSEHSIELQTLEKIKTLNFNMGSAFMNLEKAINKLNIKKDEH
jgi:glutaredoxin